MFKLQVLIIPQNVLLGLDNSNYRSSIENNNNIDNNNNNNNNINPNNNINNNINTTTTTNNNNNNNNSLIFRNNSSSPNNNVNAVSTPISTANSQFYNFYRTQQPFNPNNSLALYPNSFIAPTSFYNNNKNNFNSKIKKFLHITSSNNSLKTISQEINQRFLKLYPHEKPLNILAIQNSEECDLDPDYTVSMVFDSSNICRVIVANDFIDSTDLILNNNGKRYLTDDLNNVMKKVRKSKNKNITKNIDENNSVNTSIWSLNDDNLKSSNQFPHNLNKPLAMRDENDTSNLGPDISLAIPDVDDTVIHPSKSEYLKLASPIVATGSPTRITSGMLNINSQPDLSKTDYVEDTDGSMYIESEGRASVSTKEDAMKKKQKINNNNNSNNKLNSSNPSVPSIKLNDETNSFIDNADLSTSSINSNLNSGFKTPEFNKTEYLSMTNKFPSSTKSKTKSQPAATLQNEPNKNKRQKLNKVADKINDNSNLNSKVSPNPKKYLSEEEATEKAAREISERIAKERAEKMAKKQAEKLAREIITKEKKEKAAKKKLEKEKLEKEKAAKEKAAKEKIEKEKIEKEKLEKEKLEKERLEKEKLEKERLEKEKLEKERLEKEKIEKERLEKERLEKEKAAKEKAAKEKIEKEKIEKEKLEKEKLEKERLEKEKLEKERLEKEKLEKARLEKEKLEKEKLEKERLEKERLEKERLEKERLEKERLEKERLEKERLEKERLEKERLEKERLEKEKAAKEKAANEKIEKEKAAKKKLEKEKLEKDKLEKEKLEKEKLEKERLDNEKTAKEKATKEKLEKERLEKERLEGEKTAKSQLIQENLRREKLEKQKLEKQKLERENPIKRNVELTRKLKIPKIQQPARLTRNSKNSDVVMINATPEVNIAAVDENTIDDDAADTEDEEYISAINTLTRDDTPEDKVMILPTKAVKVTKLSVNINSKSKQPTLKKQINKNIKDISNNTDNSFEASRHDEISADINLSNILPKKNRTSSTTVKEDPPSNSSDSNDSSDSDSSDSSDEFSSDDETSKPKIVTAPKTVNNSKISKEKDIIATPKNISHQAIPLNPKIDQFKKPLISKETDESTNSIELSKRSSLPRLSAFLDKKLPEVRIQKQQAKVSEKKSQSTPTSSSDSSSDESDSTSSSDSASDSDSDSDSDDNSDSDSDSNKTSSTNNFINSRTASQFVTKKSTKKPKKNKGFSALMKDFRK